MIQTFSGDYRIMRVVFSSGNPMETLHKFRTGQYSVITLLDMLEMLDVRETIQEDFDKMSKYESKENRTGKR